MDEEKQDQLVEHMPTSTGRRGSSGAESQTGSSSGSGSGSDDESVNRAVDNDDEKSDHPHASSRSEHQQQKQHDQDQTPDSTTATTSTSTSATRTQSRASSTRSRAMSIVPRSQRRGLFGRFAILPEVERPYEYANKTKWLITLIVALCAAGAPVGAAIFYPALPEMAVDLNTTPTVTNLTVAVYMLAMSIFPLWWSSFSETLGRRTIYIISFTLFVVFSVLSAVSTNVAMLIVMRILGGGASASVQAVGAGTIADVWEPRERGRAMGIFYLGPLLGPLVGPIIGGVLSQRWGWQATMWFLAIFGAIMLVMIFFCLPETLARRRPLVLPPPAASTHQQQQQGEEGSGLSRTRSVQQRTAQTATFLKRAFIDPLQILLNLRSPPIAITVLFASVTFGALFVLNICVQASFSGPPYHFPELILGLLYLPTSLGYIIASILGGRWTDAIMAREARRAARYDSAGKLIYHPEDRMKENAWIAATMYPVALIWFGWTVDKGVVWIVPAIANFFFGVGSMLVFGAAMTMLTEFMPRRSSGGIAINNFVRNIFSSVGAIVTQPLINVMGVGWLCTTIGIISFVTAYVCIWSLRRYGPKWRVEMDTKMKAES